MGRGYFSFDQFSWAPVCLSDACKRARFAGGGWVSGCGRFSFFTYGAADRRKPIDFLEGDSWLAAVEALCHTWHRKLVPFGLDNMSMKGAHSRGWSHADRLNLILRRLFHLQLKFEFILVPFWLSSKDNLVADDFSRARIENAIRHAYETGLWDQTTFLRQHSSAGQQRVSACSDRVEQLPPSAADRLATVVKSHLSHKAWNKLIHILTGNGKLIVILALLFFCPTAEGAGGKDSKLTARCISVPRCSIFDGLPAQYTTRVDDWMDNRLAPSSMRTVEAALRIWRIVARLHGWFDVIETFDEHRGGKMCAFVAHMTDDTSLVWGTINNYVWGLRHWMKLQHQADPVYGIDEWEDLMKSCKVLTIVPSEPRRRFRREVLEQLMDACDLDCFESVQFIFFCLVLYCTFSRAECPCPKSFEGREAFDVKTHWCVNDILPVCIHGVWCLGVRFKALKQDPRVERPEARGNLDWAYIGDCPGKPHSIFLWYKRLKKFYATGRKISLAPFFMARDRQRAYTYACAAADLRSRLVALGLDPALEGTIHGLRVEGHEKTCKNHPLGAPMASAQGLWSERSDARTRYHRFGIVRDVLTIPAALFADGPIGAPLPDLREVSRTGTSRGTRPVLPDDDDDSDAESDDEGEESWSFGDASSLPRGWEHVVAVNGKRRNYYVNEDRSRRLYSLKAVLEHVSGEHEPGSPSPTAQPLPEVSSPACSPAQQDGRPPPRGRNVAAWSPARKGGPSKSAASREVRGLHN